MALLALCALGYLAQQGPTSEGMLVHFALWPLVDSPGMPPFQPWQLLSYGFLHGDTSHIVFNSFALWMFGSELERFWRPRAYAVFIVVCIVGAGLTQLIVGLWSADPRPTIGISGAVYGVLLGYGAMFPNRIIMPLFPPIPMKARIAVMLFAAMEMVLGVFTTGSGVAHFAHLGGLASGYLLIQYWRGRLPVKPATRLRY
jgi:membrane associated rhomboid family serine protease